VEDLKLASGPAKFRETNDSEPALSTAFLSFDSRSINVKASESPKLFCYCLKESTACLRCCWWVCMAERLWLRGS